MDAGSGEDMMEGGMKGTLDTLTGVNCWFWFCYRQYNLAIIAQTGP